MISRAKVRIDASGTPRRRRQYLKKKVPRYPTGKLKTQSAPQFTEQSCF
jgi:hypothetical protein